MLRKGKGNQEGPHGGGGHESWSNKSNLDEWKGGKRSFQVEKLTLDQQVSNFLVSGLFTLLTDTAYVDCIYQYLPYWKLKWRIEKNFINRLKIMISSLHINIMNIFLLEKKSRFFRTKIFNEKSDVLFSFLLISLISGLIKAGFLMCFCSQLIAISQIM